MHRFDEDALPVGEEVAKRDWNGRADEYTESIGELGD